MQKTLPDRKGFPTANKSRWKIEMLELMAIHEPRIIRDAEVSDPGIVCRGPFERLDHLARCSTALRAIASADLTELADLLDAFLAGNESLDEVFGVATRQGFKRANSAWRRENAIRSAAGQVRSSNVPRRLAEILKQYEETNWPREQDYSANPHAPGTISADLWVIINEGPPLTAERKSRAPSERTIQRALWITTNIGRCAPAEQP